MDPNQTHIHNAHRFGDMLVKFRTCGFVLPAAMSGCFAALDLLLLQPPGIAPPPVHWLLHGDDPAIAAAALAESLLSADGNEEGGAGDDGMIAKQRLEEIAQLDVVAASAAALVPARGAGSRLLANARSLEVVAAAAMAAAAEEGHGSASTLLASWCGGDVGLARSLASLFS